MGRFTLSCIPSSGWLASDAALGVITHVFTVLHFLNCDIHGF